MLKTRYVAGNEILSAKTSGGRERMHSYLREIATVITLVATHPLNKKQQQENDYIRGIKSSI